MANIVYVTDENMLSYHRLNNNKTMNFWRISTKSFNHFYEGELIFFMSKDRRYIRKREKGIIGFGKMVKQHKEGVRKMWNLYGVENGFSDYEFFKDALLKYNNQVLPKKIASMYLKEIVFFQNPIYLSEFDAKVTKQLESFTYLDDDVVLKILAKAKKIGFDLWSNLDEQNNKIFDEELLRVSLASIYKELPKLNYQKNDLKKIKQIIGKYLNNHQDVYYFNSDKTVLCKIIENDVEIILAQGHKRYFYELIGFVSLFKQKIEHSQLKINQIRFIIIDSKS